MLSQNYPHPFLITPGNPGVAEIVRFPQFIILCVVEDKHPPELQRGGLQPQLIFHRQKSFSIPDRVIHWVMGVGCPSEMFGLLTPKPPEPQRGGTMVAHGKAAAAAALGIRPPLILFSKFGFVTPGGAALARGYYHVVPTELWLGSLRMQFNGG